MKIAPFARFRDAHTDFSIPEMPDLEDGAMVIADMRAKAAPSSPPAS